jgi:hypothetical protein
MFDGLCRKGVAPLRGRPLRIVRTYPRGFVV